MMMSSNPMVVKTLDQAGVLDQDSIGYIFGLSTWQSGLALIFLLFTVFSLFYICRKWGKNKALLFSFIIGLIGLTIFGFIFHYTAPISQVDENALTWVDEVNSWLTMPSYIFLALISFIIPLYVFTSIILLINNKNKKAKTHAWMFSSSMILLVILPLLGIAVAIMLIPLINLIPHEIIDYSDVEVENPNTSIPNIIVKIMPFTLIIFTSPAFLGSVVILAIFLGVVIKTTEKKHAPRHKDIVHFFETVKLVNGKYLKYILMLIPLVIATRLPLLMMAGDINQIEFVGYYLGLFLLGGLIILIILTIIILITSPAKKHKMLTLGEHWASSFANPSLATMLPVTKRTTRKLGAGEDISEITPTLGTSMGLIMCGGFTPALLAFLTQNNMETLNTNALTLSFVFLVIIYAFIASFGTSGVAHADSIIILAVLGSLGLPPEVYLTIMVISPITELIAVSINSTGQVAVTMINEAIHHKKDPNCCIREFGLINDNELREIQHHLEQLTYKKPRNNYRKK